LVVATITLVVLVEALLRLLLLLLSTILRVVALLVVLLLLILRRVSSIGLTRLERSGTWLERGDSGSEAALRGGGVHVKLLLSLLSEVVILSRGIVLPRVRGRHCVVFDGGGYIA
jgi:hypothetical protein